VPGWLTWLIIAVVATVALLFVYGHLRRRNKVWLTVGGIKPALGPGKVIPGTKMRETLVSVGVDITNRHPTNNVSLSFRLDDPAKTPSTLDAAGEADLSDRVAKAAGRRDLAAPVAVGAQERVHGHVWFLFNGAPKDMPVKRLAIIDHVNGGEFGADLPEKFVELAAGLDQYTEDAS
jgi:hypothetical protein